MTYLFSSLERAARVAALALALCLSSGQPAMAQEALQQCSGCGISCAPKQKNAEQYEACLKTCSLNCATKAGNAAPLPANQRGPNISFAISLRDPGASSVAKGLASREAAATTARRLCESAASKPTDCQIAGTISEGCLSVVLRTDKNQRATSFIAIKAPTQVEAVKKAQTICRTELTMQQCRPLYAGCVEAPK